MEQLQLVIFFGSTKSWGTTLLGSLQGFGSPNRGFFDEPDFGFNTGREMFDFPGDERGGVERVPQLPEIENQEMN